MKSRHITLTLLFVFFATATLAQKRKYPETRKGEVVEDYHGAKVADPYRWLEDLDSEETRAWVEAQNKVTFSYLDKIPEREMLKKRLTALWDYPKYGVPFKRGKRYFYAKNDGLQNQSVYYMVKSLKDKKPKVLIDPNKFSEDGTVALTTMAFSKDGRKLVYGASASGSDWRTFRVRNVETCEDYGEVIEWVKFSGASWQKSGRFFFTAATTSRKRATPTSR